MARGAVLSDDPVAAEAAEDVLMGGSSALGAVVAGFFASAGAYGGVFLSSVVLLLGGVGKGARTFDGRVRQPGLGTKRPRGLQAGQTVPDAARVGVPAGPAALLVACGYDEQLRLRSLLKPGIRRARTGGAEGREALLRRIEAVGAAALTENSFLRPFLKVGGEPEGGLVTPTDFRTFADLDQAAAVKEIGGDRYLVPPWEDPAEDPDEAVFGVGYALCAVDPQGMFAVMAYRRVTQGIPIEELELEAPAMAEPVRRGVTRVAPGSAIPAPAPIALRLDTDGAPNAALAAPRARALDADCLSSPPLSITWSSQTRTATPRRS